MSQANGPNDALQENKGAPSTHSGASQTGNAGNAIDLDLSGRQLGDYRLLRRLGRGAMADVYLAEQGSLRRQVALKTLKRQLAEDQTYVRRFHMEAQAAAALVQANIVQIYEVGCIDGWHYIAQEFVDGQNLSQFTTRSGAPPLKLAVAIMRQVSAALCKAADRGIVHRDIKPENIILSRSGEVKVADFGLARIGGDETLKLTQIGITMGTPLYMSPEQVEGKPLDPRSDIYSFGVTCYQMLGGRPPFRGDTALSVALQHVRTQPDRLENLRPDLPPALCRIIHNMLAKDPADRQQNPRELLQELRGLQIEGLDLQWPAELDELTSVESAALAHAEWAATQRLQAVMNSQSFLLGNRRWLMYTAAACIAALLTGCAAAWALRKPFLLNVPAAETPAVEEFKTVEQQFAYARSQRTEAAWQSVIDNFDDRFLVPQAEEELALLYLESFEPADREKAAQLFEHLANDYPDVDIQLRATGLAGQAIVLSLDNKAQQSEQKLVALDKLIGDDWKSPRASRYLDSRMRAMLSSANDRNSKVLNDEFSKQFQKKLETLEEPSSQ